MCAGKDEELTEDIAYLRELYSSIKEAKDEASPPTCLHSDFDLALRSLRDLVDDGVARIVLDDPEEHARVAAFAERFLPRFADRVELWSGDRPLFSAAGVEKGLGHALSRKVGLPSGAYLVIDHTEALTAIDVNTGRYVGKKSLEDTILEVNLEAAKAVPEQLRLRDIGGLIVVEGLILAVAGGAGGTLAALAFLSWGGYSLSNEGLSFSFGAGPDVWATALLASVAVGVAAGLVPAFRASRIPIAGSFRAV